MLVCWDAVERVWETISLSLSHFLVSHTIIIIIIHIAITIHSIIIVIVNTMRRRGMQCSWMCDSASLHCSMIQFSRIPSGYPLIIAPACQPKNWKLEIEKNCWDKEYLITHYTDSQYVMKSIALKSEERKKLLARNEKSFVRLAASPSH